ncbi:MAG: NAD(P)-binding protein, partial [Bacteroidota bacterium]
MSQAYTNRPLSSSTSSNTIDTLVIGSGMAGLTAACLLTHYGQRVHVLEQNWLPGGCSSSYPRKNYIFESGATTLVGLDEYMPVKHLLDVTGVEIKPWVLPVPMKVYLKDGTVITRHHDLEAWIEEAERVFGPKGQRPFWEYCFKIAQFVWEVSLKQRAFPPSNISDLFYAARHFRPKQLGFATLAFKSMKSLLDDHGLLDNKRFVAFVDEQLLITAQNHHPEVNVPFGATALCYTNFTNYYMPGGLLKMVEPMVEYLKTKGSNVTLQAP